MNRDQNRQEKIRKIVTASKKLFAKQGYEKTNIRQVLKEARLSTGTLYHFFRNKEDILLSIYTDVFEQLSIHVKKIARECKEPLLSFSISAAIQIGAVSENEDIFNIYRVSWTIRAIEEYFLRLRVNGTKQILENANLGLRFTDDEIYAREVAVNAAFGALMEAKVEGRVAMKTEDIWLLIIKMWFSEFGVSKATTNKIIEQTKEIMRKRGSRLKKRFLNGFRNNF